MQALICKEVFLFHEDPSMVRAIPFPCRYLYGKNVRGISFQYKPSIVRGVPFSNGLSHGERYSYSRQTLLW
jgi:hypothetical protein